MTEEVRKKTPDHQVFQFGPWTVSSCKSHILESEGPQREKFEETLELPQIPEMVFAENCLKIENECGGGIYFSALEALKLVDAHHDPVKVAASRDWQSARSNCEHIKNVVSPFDWTYTTNYKGSLIGEEKGFVKVTPTTERIDIEKLKQREPIQFYDDVLLFEDELSDNGTSVLNVKMRVMPSSFFILMRLFVRVDQVLIRVNDTRIYHKAGTNFCLREFSSKEESTQNIPVSAQIDPNMVSQHLQTNLEVFEKLEF